MKEETHCVGGSNKGGSDCSNVDDVGDNSSDNESITVVVIVVVATTLMVMVVIVMLVMPMMMVVVVMVFVVVMVTTNYGCDNDGDGDDGVGGDNDKYDINGSNNGDNNDDNKKEETSQFQRISGDDDQEKYEQINNYVKKAARESGWCSRRTWVVRLDGSGLRRLTCSAYENGDLAAEDWDKLKGLEEAISKFIKREYNDLPLAHERILSPAIAQAF
ncbi:hypothetical protein JHK86_003534 [Glycine max]|nr:hypothetical protein JHK86_003534 [Glycine max]